MFSDHFQTTNRSGSGVLFVTVGALVMMCLLAAMAFVADGQVKKSESRELQLASQRLALAQCFENMTGINCRNCARDGHRADSVGVSPCNPASNKPTGHDSSAVRAPARGVVAAAFASH